ncbi:hypothetical protein H4Q26_017642 [Puccinia striiformis f. sp. tritici PST-130]|nr:hypothetical protein H4Q26_017642 [Puccinia striiformis f. sp. tritici PST-130]
MFDTPLLNVPEGNWYCDACIVSTVMNSDLKKEKNIRLLKQSRRQSLVKDGGHRGPGDVEEDASSAWSTKPFKDQLILEDFMEKEFWRLVESPTETVEVEYGADINTAAYGSGFPNLEKHPFDPYSRDGWNLNNLLSHKGLY